MNSTAATGRHEALKAGSTGLPSSAAGKPQRVYIGIDVGGTKIAAGLVSFPAGRVMAQRLKPTPGRPQGRLALDAVLSLARELAGEAGPLGQRLAGIGLGVCELVDREGHLASSNCIQWLDLPVREEFSTLAPTVIEADVRAAALAEALLGAGKLFRTFLYVTVGTGISCCLMLDSEPHLGTHGATGTMASSPVSLPCEQCGHVSRRTLEEIAAGPALMARFNSAHGHAASGHDVLAAAAGGSEVAAGIVRTAAEALGSQVALLVNVLDPGAVIVGGGLGLSAGPYWEHFLASTRRHIWSNLHRELPVLRAATGVDAGWMGAAARAWRMFPDGSDPAPGQSPHP